jgi:hypothetical protein
VKIAPQFVDGIRELIAGARTTVARGVDLVQVHTNFEIGRRIVEEEQRGEDRAAYGEEVVRALADRLTGEFGKGFSISNLAYMRTFYLLYQDRRPILQTASGELGPSQIGQTVTGQFNARAIGQTATDQLAILQSLTGKSGHSPIPQTASGELRRAAPRLFALSWSHYVFLLRIKDPMDEIAALDAESSEVLRTIRRLL